MSDRLSAWLRSCEVGDVVPPVVDGGLRHASVSGPFASGRQRGTDAGRVDTPSPEMAALIGKWLVACTGPRLEWAAAGELEARGCETFLPWLPRSVIPHRHNRRSLARRVDRQPAFPGYLFVRLAAGATLQALAAERGVRTVLSVGDGIVAVPEPAMAALRERCSATGELGERYVPPALVARLRRGDRFEVVDGPFASFVGLVKALDGDARISAWLEGMTSEVCVNLPTAICRKV